MTDLENPPSARPDDEHLVAILFDKPSRATEVLVNLMHLQQEGALRLGDAVVISKDESGRAVIHETMDVTPSKGALIGGWLGVFAGILAGPLAIAGGLAAGALYGKLVDKGLADDWVKQMSEWLDAGRSALAPGGPAPARGAPAPGSRWSRLRLRTDSAREGAGPCSRR